MQRSSFPWLWVGLAAILLLLPGTAGRLLLDLLGGLTLFLLILPLIAAGTGFLAWQLIRRRLKTCGSCGTITFASDVCPACGSWFDDQGNNAGKKTDPYALDPSEVIINVEAIDVEPSSDRNNKPSS